MALLSCTRNKGLAYMKDSLSFEVRDLRVEFKRLDMQFVLTKPVCKITNQHPHCALDIGKVSVRYNLIALTLSPTAVSQIRHTTPTKYKVRSRGNGQEG